MLCLIAVAGFGSVAIFLGWMLELPLLRSFGVGGFPMWPLPAIGYALLALGFWATIAQWRWAGWMLVVPIVIAVAALSESLFGVSIGIDRILFPEQLAQSTADYAGRPTANSVATLGLLAGALILARRKSHAAFELANLLASSALCFALFSAALLLVIAPMPGAIDPSILAPLSCSVVALILAAAFLIWRYNAGWTLLLTDHRVRRPFIGAALPLVIALPILPTLVERWGAQSQQPPTQGELLGVICNVAIIGFLLWLAVHRITRQQGILQEQSLAMDITAIAITRLDGTITYWSQGCQRLFGWSGEEAIGRNKYELLQSRIGTENAGAVSRTESTERELIEHRRDGTALCILELCRALDREHDAPLLVLKMLDISTRVGAESALRVSEAQVRSIIETMSDAVVVIDDRGVIRTFSTAAERMFGYPSDLAIGENVTMLMPEIERARHDISINTYLTTGERHVIGSTSSFIAQRADGSLFPIDLHVGETWMGKARMFTGVIRDVTERNSADLRLSELSIELAHVSRQNEMSELAADLAHELNQPLSATANFLATARILTSRGADGPRIAELLRMGEEQTLRAGEIIRRLRNFLAKGDVEMGAESVGQTVREAVGLVFFGAARLDIALVYRLDPEAEIIFADRIQIQQVLVNLLRNAMQALRSAPNRRCEIVIAARRIDDLVEISVSDNGPGLPDTLRDQLYARFATTKRGTAMGIGLSISRRIIEAHGGTLVAENGPKGGACFRFTLPAVERIAA